MNYKYITIEQHRVSRNGRSQYTVLGKNSKVLGFIRWHIYEVSEPEYILECDAYQSSGFDPESLRDIANFCEEQTLKQKG